MMINKITNLFITIFFVFISFTFLCQVAYGETSGKNCSSDAVIHTARHEGRTVISLNNGWEFKLDKETSFKKVNLPHTWNAEDAVDDKKNIYRGEGIYKKNLKLNLTQGQKAFLYFEGANQSASLTVNSQFIGEHKGGYTSFAFDISNAVGEGDNQIEIAVSNQYDVNIPPLSMDYIFYGGIYRDVYLVVTNPVHFDLMNFGSEGILISTPKVSKKVGEVVVQARLKNEMNKEQKVKLIHRLIAPNGKEIKRLEKDVALLANAGISQVDMTAKIASPELWSPDSPSLYTVVSELINPGTGEVIDQVVNPLGFRWFSMDPKKGFFLNGEHLKLTGVCKHQDFEDIGSAVSNDLFIRDLEMIKEMGANCYRSSHYPQDPSVFDACDRLGLLVIDEIPLVNSITESSDFAHNSNQMMTEMIMRDYNHPSIFSWGLSNEIGMTGGGPIGSESGKAYDRYLNKVITSLDSIAKVLEPGRLTTQSVHYKTARYESSDVIKIGDFIGSNLYMGWYVGEPDSLVEVAKGIQSLSGDKPIVISEYGAGADPRLRSNNPRRYDFTIDYQTMVHKKWLNSFLNNDFVSASFVWNFADFCSPFRGDAMPFYNSKGLVAADRTPKDVFYFYKAALVNKPTINIGMKSWKYHSGVETTPGLCSKKIEVFANTQDAELYINGKSLGKKAVNDFSAEWEVPFIKGQNLIEVVGISESGSTVKDYHSLEFNLIPSNLKEMKPGDVIRVNAGSSAYFLDEDEKSVWIPDTEYSKGGFGFVGGMFLVTKNNRVDYREGVDQNINKSVKDPLFQTQRIATSNFKADVPEGRYEVTFCLADLAVRTSRLVYELGSENDITQSNISGKYEFDIIINGQKVAEKLNPRKQAGKLTAYEFSAIVYSKGGLDIEFKSNEETTCVNAIKLRKLK